MTKAEKEAFKKRMAAGRKKAAKARGAQNPKKRKPAKKAAKKKQAAKRPAKKKAAKKNARNRASPPGARTSPKKGKNKHNPRGRCNHEGDSLHGAEKLFERFHGKPADRILEYTQQFRYPDNFAELGLPLKELRVYLNDANPEFAITGFGNCQVVSTPDGSNIYFIGGDQSLDLTALDIFSDKDVVELGPCVYIKYHTVKGFHDFEPIDYWHPFGEEDGILPTLAYDRLNKTLFLLGGNYRVRPEGIVN